MQQRGVEVDVTEYLKDPLSQADFERFLRLLPNPAADLVRKDKRFKELGLNEADYTTPEAVVTVLLAHPELMQCPIIIRGRQAVLARPGEMVTASFPLWDTPLPDRVLRMRSDMGGMKA